MRALLKAFVLATAAMTWAASRPVESGARAKASRPPTAAAATDAADSRAAASASAGADRESAARMAAPAAGVRDSGRVLAPVVPLGLVVVDGETGRAMPGVWSLLRWRRTGGGWRNGCRLRPGSRVQVMAFVAAPGGAVADQCGWYEHAGFVSRRAHGVRVVAPLRREAEIFVRVVTGEGRPVPDAKVIRTFMGGQEPRLESSEPRVPPEELGEWVCEEELVEESRDEDLHASQAEADLAWSAGGVRVRGLPHLLDERYWIVVRAGSREGVAGMTLGPFGEVQTAVVRLSPGPGTAIRQGRGGTRNLGAG